MAEAEGVVLRCEGLTKRFGELVAVDDLGFSIREGETYGLLGPNGAGKTTAISMIAGIMARDAGEILLDGEPLTAGSVALKAKIGYVPQQLAVYPDLTGRENLRFFARLYGLGRKDAARRVEEVLEVVGLADRAKDLAKNYSGGMQRRLNVGLGLLHRPRLLILDEPTAGVDPQSRNSILDGVARLAAEGMAVLYTTHYMEEAERLCDRVGIIDQGRIRAEGTQRELVALVGEQDRVTLTGDGELEPLTARLAALPEVTGAGTADGRVEVFTHDARALLPRLLHEAEAEGTTVRSVQVVEPDLEAVFLHLTGKALRN
ncbi:ABC transporter ATP-binding protein [Actinocorallia aurantiaca]|uniref:Linearmycin resistance ATP-binding protein LnrL n=1 Tax=Actinocorallia aurantiaca TaxID=46204 RepID=A0ABP6GHS4_9ACTN